MKFIHLSDLHLGRRLNEFSLIEDQKYILGQIVDIIKNENPEFVILAGDIYDKPVPSAEAVELFDNFLVKLSKMNLSVFVISGNHDSAERIAFASRILKNTGVYMSPVYDGNTEKVTFTDEHGNVNVYMLPFIKPTSVRRFFPDSQIESYTDAVRTAVQNMCVDTAERNILVTHQFVTGAVVSDSEELSVGGSDNIDIDVFKDFDYVALGHIHSPQNMEKGRVRYSGSILKYSVSEANQKKSLSVIEVNEKGNTEVRTVELVPLRDLRKIRGTYDELTLLENYKNTNTNDYIHVTLTDENDVVDAVIKLRTIYPNIVKLEYDNARTASFNQIDNSGKSEAKSEIELFSELFELQNNVQMTSEQQEIIEKLIAEIREEHI